jgi:hypothetical protein
MALGAGVRRLLALHEADVKRMSERFAVRVTGHDGVQHSATERRVTFTRGKRALWTARAEPLARFAGGRGLLRWWWHGKLGSSRSPLDDIVIEGQRHGVEELTQDSVQTESLQTSETLCALAAHLAAADGLLRMDDGGDASFFALYDAGSHMTIPAPPLSAGSLVPAANPSRTLPAAPLSVPSPSGPSEPSRELVSPVALATMSFVQASLPSGFGQALLAVMVDAQGEKARIFVHLTAADANGDLQSLEPSQRLFDAVVVMISEQRKRGGAELHRLVLRLRPTDRGASIDVTVT